MTIPKRKQITDPIEWIKSAVQLDEAHELGVAMHNDAAGILEIAEAQRIGILTLDELQDAIVNAKEPRAYLVEVTKRLAQYTQRLGGTEIPNNISPDQSFVVPPGAHVCTGPSLPPGGIPCLCIRGEDHTEEFFEVKIGGKSHPINGPTEVSETNDETQE